MELLNDIEHLRWVAMNSILRWAAFDTDDLPEFFSDLTTATSHSELQEIVEENFSYSFFQDLVCCKMIRFGLLAEELINSGHFSALFLLNAIERANYLRQRNEIFNKILSLIYTEKPEGEYWASISHEPITEEIEKIPPFVVRKYAIAVSLGKKSISSIVDLAKFHDRFMEAIADASGLDDTVYNVDSSTISDHSLIDDVEYKDAFFVCHFLVFTKSSL